MTKVVLVTGGTSGIGLAAARAFARKGCRVYTVSRRPFAQDGICHLTADVTREDQVVRAVAQVMQREGRIDTLVNCAGFGISGAVEFTELEDAKRQFDVNFFGTVNMTKAVLPHMRRAGQGRIVNISSVAAPANIPFQTYYSASKAAINSYTQCLANEVRPLGISVTAVMPGDICTGFTAARKKSIVGDDVYQGRIGRSVASMERDEQNGMKPEAAGRYICAVAEKKHVKPLYSIGFLYKCASVLCALLPSRFRNWMIGRIYAR